MTTARSGTEELAAARADRPALIVLDLMLPGMSGYDVLEQLRARDDTRHIAVLMLTARRDEPDRIRGLALGADDYLTKPFSPQELVLRVGAILTRTVDMHVQRLRTKLGAAADLIETVRGFGYRMAVPSAESP